MEAKGVGITKERLLRALCVSLALALLTSLSACVAATVLARRGIVLHAGIAWPDASFSPARLGQPAYFEWGEDHGLTCHNLDDGSNGHYHLTFRQWQVGPMIVTQDLGSPITLDECRRIRAADAAPARTGSGR